MSYIYIIAFCIVWMNQKPKIKLFKIKPFSCELCMAFWLTFGYQIYSKQDIGFAFIVALITPIALNIYNKIWIKTL